MSENKMPTMPSLNVPTHQESETVIEPAAEVLKKPELVSQTTVLSNVMKIPVPKEGIKVVATRKGFYNNNRISEGFRFTVAKFEELGTWMKCEEAAHEEIRVKMLAEKKTRAIIN